MMRRFLVVFLVLSVLLGTIGFDKPVLSQQAAKSSFVLLAEARRGNTRSQYLLGIRYLVGTKSLPRDMNSGIYWLDQASEDGYDLASIALGNLFYEGYLMTPNNEIAAEYYLKAAEGGNTDGQVMFGYMSFTGRGVPQNKNLGAQWFKQSAINENPRGQYALGLAYLRGEGLPISIGKAIKWLSLASRNGNGKATHALGVIYNTGDVVGRNKNLANQFFSASMKQGYEWAGYDLALSLINDDYDSASIKNRRKAYALASWMNMRKNIAISIGNNDQNFVQKVERLYQYINQSAIEKDKKESQRYFLLLESGRFDQFLDGDTA